ncbi:MAG: alpha/beta hydrolase [Alcaligenaceae bacterium]|nr:alpha/beta hydrolase [Alcaligenaceae bacterium]
MEQRQYRLQVNGLTLQVNEWGPENARPIIMLHGIRGYSSTFEGIARFLQPFYRVIAFDQRGRGQSQWDPGHNYYTDAYVDDLKQVIEQLGLKKTDLLGHSMGGINAIVFAAKYPEYVEKLIIEDAGPGAFENSPGSIRICRELENTPGTFENWEAASVFMRQLRPSVTEQARQDRLKNMLKPLEDGRYTWQYDHEGIAKTRLSPDPARVLALMPYIRDIKCATLIIRGGNTDYLQKDMVQAMLAENPLLDWCEIPDAGHYIHDDQPALFAHQVKQFLLPGQCALEENKSRN